MDILLNGKEIVAIAPRISKGIFDEDFEKWKMADEYDRLLYYAIDHNYTHIMNVELPEDYEDGKYYYDNGEFVLVSEWKPYVSPEERIAILEKENAKLKADVEAQAEVLDFLLML